MTEENVTISVIERLRENGWKILSFDYPQSGTGKLIKPDSKEKNLGGFIPDIVAFKNGVVLFWENKDHFVFEDFTKIKNIKESEAFIKPIKDFLSKIDYGYIYFGIAIPKVDAEINKASKYYKYIDFFVTVDSREVDILYKVNSEVLVFNH
jgi:hypothetical protein